MGERVRRAGVLGAILVLLGVIAAGLVLGGGRPADRAYELEQRLRCPVCKTVSIAESMSDTAVAMRGEVEQQVDAGRSDQEIIDWFTARYGEWVLMDPPAEGDTLPLWLVPLGVAIAGALLVASRRRPAADTPPLAEDDRARVAEALARMRTEDDDGDRL